MTYLKQSPRDDQAHPAGHSPRASFPRLLASMLAVILLVLLSPRLLAQAPPATFSRNITNGSTTLTVDFALHPIRSTNFNVQVQDSTGVFTPYTAGAERTYLGTIANRPGALAAGYLRADGTAL